MAGSALGSQFKITTWGESHGKGIGVVIDGCPAGLPLTEADIQEYLNRRRPGQNKFPPRGMSQILRSSYPAFLKGKPQEPLSAFWFLIKTSVQGIMGTSHPTTARAMQTIPLT